MASAQARCLAGRSAGPFGCGLPRPFSRLQVRPGLLARRDSRFLRLDRGRGRVSRPGAAGLRLRQTPGRLIRPGTLVGRSSRCLAETAAHGLEFGRPGGLDAPQRRQRLALGLLRGADRAQLFERLGQRPLRLRDRPRQGEIPRRHRARHFTPLHGEIGLGRRQLPLEPGPVAQDAAGVAGGPGVAQLEVGQQAPGRLVRGQAIGLGLGPRRQLAGDGRGQSLGVAQRRQRRVGLAPACAQLPLRLLRTKRRLNPARTGLGDDRAAVFASRRLPRGLLLGLGRQASGLGT